MKTTSFIAAILFLFTIPSAFAEGRVHLSSYGFSTSDDLKFSSAVLTYETYRSNLFWPYAAEGDVGQGYNVEINRISFSNKITDANALILTGAWIFKPSANINHLFRVGALEWRQINDGRHYDGIFQYKNQFILNKNWLFESDISRDYLFRDILRTDRQFQNLEATTLSPIVMWLPADRWRAKYSGRYSELEDSNGRANSDLQVMYGVSTDPWFWIGPGVNYLSFRTQRPVEYYSPAYVRSVGPRAEFSYKIMDKLNFNFGGSFNWTVEDGVASRGHYLSASLEFGNRESPGPSINFENIKSERQGSTWDSSGLSFGLRF
jgi:hypothetical protein